MDKYICDRCGTPSTIEEWDTKTIAECCSNRKLRRSYVSIGKNVTQSKWYRCPNCGTSTRKSNLTKKEV